MATNYKSISAKPGITRLIIYALLMALLLLPGLGVGPACTARQNNLLSKIVVEANFTSQFYYQLRGVFTIRDVVKIQSSPLHYYMSAPPSELIPEKINNGMAKWVIYTDQPLKISPPLGVTIIMTPGDSVHIAYNNNTPLYSGNKPLSLTLLNELMQSDEDEAKKTNSGLSGPSTLADFLTWNQHLDNKITQQLAIIETFRDKIPFAEYEYYKLNLISSLESERVNTFIFFQDTARKNHLPISFSDFAVIWDSTQYKPWAKWFRSNSNYYGSIHSISNFNKMEVGRNFDFDYTKDSLKSKETRTYLYYVNAKKNYSGLLRERLIAYILDRQIINEKDLESRFKQSLLEDYYKEPGFPEYKAWMKKMEKEAQPM